MWLMLQQEEPDDYVIATGEQHSVREFAELAFARAGIQLEWSGSGADERGIEANTGRVVIEVDPKYYRPTEVETLLGDATKAWTKLGWKPVTPFQSLVEEMVDHDVRQAAWESLALREGVELHASVEEVGLDLFGRAPGARRGGDPAKAA
jgi:GDPmannose 4,6-dehydratase